MDHAKDLGDYTVQFATWPTTVEMTRGPEGEPGQVIWEGSLLDGEIISTWDSAARNTEGTA